MKRTIVYSLAALAGLALADAPVSALVYTSLLEYKDTGSGVAQGGPYGQVTLTEVNPNQVDVSVTLFPPEVGFLNTGGPHEPFLFNLTGNYTVTVNNAPGQTFYDGGYDSNTTTPPNFSATPFGNFTNKIGCCNDLNGGVNKSLPPLTFSVYDAGGLTFAGIGATFDPVTGRLLTLGTGNHFVSNSGGWWFTADLVDSSGATFNVAARDAFAPQVPEPATWTLAIVGFGMLGMSMRRHRRTKVNFQLT